MPKLKPETISMTGLNLFQHLCNLARLATSAYDSGPNCEVRERSAHTHTHTHLLLGHALQQGLVHRARLHTCLQSSLHADFEVKYNREAPHSSKLTHSPT